MAFRVLRWVKITTGRATRGWIRFLWFLIPAMVLRAVLLYSGDADLWTPSSAMILLYFAAGLYPSAWLYAALAPVRSGRIGYLVSWVLSGALAGFLLMGLPPVLTGPKPGTRAAEHTPNADPVEWVAIWTTIGAVGGYAYGRIAEDRTEADGPEDGDASDGSDIEDPQRNAEPARTE